MKLDQLCSGVKPSCPNLKSRENFIDALFKAAGQILSISVSYKRQLCNGGKPFTEDLKAPLRGKDNLVSLTDFFSKEIDDTKLQDVIAAFGIPEADNPNKKALSTALALQMKLLLDSVEEDVDDILALEYQKAKSEDFEPPKGASFIPMQPLYPGDSFYMQTSRPVYKVGLDQVFEHTWKIDNIGTQTWSGRKLFFSNNKEVRPCAESNYIDIPETPPGKSVTITTHIDPRSFEKRSECVWIMVDKDARDCFPRTGQFSVIVDVTFQIGS